jgi:predicted nucleic acid-binding protein
MRAIVDTSAYYAMANRLDPHHAAAAALQAELATRECEFVTVSYIVAETVALVQARRGLEPLRKLRSAIEGGSTIIWVDAELHAAAWDELERIGRRQVSLADCALAVAALREGISDVFAYDPHFALWDLNVIG